MTVNDEQAKTKIRVALYARVSTAEQTNSNQLVALRQVAAQRGWEVTQEYCDQISGAKARRPKLDELLSDARHGHIDVVMVAAFDRLGRSVVHLLHTLDELNGCGVQFVSLREGVDTQGPMGRAITTILGAVAEFERELIRERVRAGMHRARLEGRRIGRKPLEVDTEQILEDREVMGYSLKRIARIHQVSKTTIGRILKSCGPQRVQESPEQVSENTGPRSAA